jgi:hypothetical protein
MQKKGFIGVLLLIMLTACFCNKPQPGGKVANEAATSENTIQKDTLAYTYKSAGGEAKACEECSYIEVNYPVFKNDNALNRAIEQKILSNLESYDNTGHKKSNDFETQLKNIADSAFKADSGSEEQSPPTTYELSINIILQGQGLIVFAVNEEFSGGAHPNTVETYINWNTTTDKPILLNSLFRDNYKSDFTKTAEQIFRKNEKIKDNEPLSNYNFENDTFAVNNNFRITPIGICFLYNTYEIQAYVEGPTELLIPYTQIKSLLQPNTVVAQYYK